MSQITNIIEAIKKQNQNETKGQLSRLEIIFMEILQVLKTNLEDAKKRAALERTFQEEKDYEDELRHDEFIEVLKNFVSMKPPIVLENETKKEEGGGFLDFLKTFLKGLVLKFTTLLGKILKVLGKLAKFSFLLLKKVTGILLKTVKIIGKLTLKLGILLGKGLMKLFRLIRHPSVLRFLTLMIKNPWVIGAILASAGLYTLIKKTPDYSKINEEEATNVLVEGTLKDVKEFSNKLKNPEKIFDTNELKVFNEETDPEKKMLMYVNKYREVRKKELEEKEIEEKQILDSFAVSNVAELKKQHGDVYNRLDKQGFFMTDDERKELTRLKDIQPVKIPEKRESGGAFLQELPTNSTIVGRETLESKRQELQSKLSQLLIEETDLKLKPESEEKTKKLEEIRTKKEQITKTLDEIRSEITRREERKTLLESEVTKLEEERNKLIKQEETERQRLTTIPVLKRDNTKLIGIQTEKAEVERKLQEKRNQLSQFTKGSTRSLGVLPLEDNVKEKPISRTYAPVNEEATNVATMYVGDMEPPGQDPNKLNLPVSQTVTKVSDENYTMPPPPNEISSSTSAIKVEPRVEKPEEQLQKFINRNKALHLRNDLKSMSLEYEELGRILKGTSSQPIKPEVSPSPISQMLNNLTIANNDLVLRNMFTLEDQVINNVSNTGRTEVLPDTPMAVEASQRDDTYTLTTVLNRYKRSYV